MNRPLALEAPSSRPLIRLVASSPPPETASPADTPAKTEQRPEWQVMPRELLPGFADLDREVAYLSYLERRIARNPRELLSHSQRILLLHRRSERTRCHAALVDLFLVLRQKGYELRKRMLLTVKNSLTRPEREFFAAHLKHGLTQADLAGNATGALLVTGVESSQPLVSLVVTDGDTRSEGSEVAYALLERGMVTESCRVWERLLRDDPGDATATMELLSVYQHYGRKEDFFRTYMELAGRKLAFRDLWHHLDRQYNKRESR